MSSSLSPSEVDITEAFADSSVLFNYTFEQDNGESEEILCNHDCDNIVSSSVRNEYKNVRDRRRDIVKSMLKSQARNEFDDWEPPSHIDLTGNDRRYMSELMSDLYSLDATKLKKRLKIEERRINRGWTTLFESSNPHIDTIWQCNRDPQILGNIRSIVDNHNDCQILCEAIDWASEGGSGTMVAADHDDMISNRNEISERISTIPGVTELTLLTPQDFLSFDND